MPKGLVTPLKMKQEASAHPVELVVHIQDHDVARYVYRYQDGFQDPLPLSDVDEVYLNYVHAGVADDVEHFD